MTSHPETSFTVSSHQSNTQAIHHGDNMAPVRRYLRISKYSVLECRIYVDNPAHVHTWLLNPRNPILPRVIESIRPLVLPKLREERERERAKKKSSKKKNIKDVVVQGNVAITLPCQTAVHKSG